MSDLKVYELQRYYKGIQQPPQKYYLAEEVDTRIKELEAAFARAEKLSRYYFKQCQKHWPQRVISDE